MGVHELQAPPHVVASIRDFLRKHPRDEFIASWIANVCGCEPLPTLLAIAQLLRDGTVGVRVSGKGMSWTFYWIGARR